MSHVSLVALLLFVSLGGCGVVHPRDEPLAGRVAQVVQDYATVVQGDTADKEAHREALHVLKKRLARLRSDERSSELVDEAVETMEQMSHCAEGRVGKCLRDLTSELHCTIRFVDRPEELEACIEDNVGEQACRRKARRGEMLLRRHEDGLLRELRSKAAQCKDLQCESEAEKVIADEEASVKESRKKRKHSWQVCDGNGAVIGGESNRSASQGGRLGMPAWAIALLVGGVCLIGCLALLLAWIMYKRRQQRSLAEITAGEMVY